MITKHTLAIVSIGLALAGAGCLNFRVPETPKPAPTPSPAATKTPTPAPVAVPSTPPSPVTTQPTQKRAVQKAPVSRTSVVQITATAFSPQVIAVAAGDTVVWTNKDAQPHTTRSDAALIWDTGSIAPGRSASHVFKSPGSYPYSDASSGLKGTVVVY